MIFTEMIFCSNNQFIGVIQYSFVYFTARKLQENTASKRCTQIDEFVNRSKSYQSMAINRLILEINEQSTSVTFHRFPLITERKQKSNK